MASQNYQRIGTVGFSGLLIITFAILYTLARQYQGNASDFPKIILAAGILFAILLIVKELVLEWTDYDFNIESGISEYLKGGESQYTSREQIKRNSILLLGIAVFFLLATLNFIIAIIITYPGMLYFLGIRDRRTLIGSTVAISVFVFVMFVLILGIPLGVF